MLRWLFLAILLGIWIFTSSVLFVDQTEYVYVTQFGRHVVTYDGRTDAGLHFKLPWPFQSALRLDRRLQYFDVPTQQLVVHDRTPDRRPAELMQRFLMPVSTSGTPFDLTATILGYDPSSRVTLKLTFDVYVCWRIAESTTGGEDPADVFVRKLGTPEKAQNFLRTEVVGRLMVELSRIYLDQLVNTDPGKLQSERMLAQLRDFLDVRAREKGVQIVDVRLRRFNHPEEVRGSVLEKIAEAKKREADSIKHQADQEFAAILAEGKEKAGRIETDANNFQKEETGKAMAARTDILRRAAERAPHLYLLVFSLEAGDKAFGDNMAQLFLSTDHWLVRLLIDGRFDNGSVPVKSPLGVGANGQGANKPPAEQP
jgi:membrane protease subunit HflC